MEFRYRKACLADAGGIAVVHVESWQSTYRGIVSDRYLDSLSVEEKKVKWEGILSEDHHTLVCTTKDGLVVGFASVGRERSGEYEGELYAIYLLREYQGRGIGRELFSRSISSLKALGFQDMFIWVLRENSSKTFYYSYQTEMVKEEPIIIGDEEHVEEGLLLTF
ncbi:GNAT family N-acetyltransferase [Rossellomorea marisflavi]|uniref:GNAT family N-acetyltransferase n=1 Tax=Rossellomorea marisflavi TaxID=189381 RepID=UPI0020424F5C|nr:GNAT family N-acetyltransferase [Rossellomorea marisflavi]MCM2605255.1 GNAT family N-acetyltransferase [Rossellomorea marisflavi]